MISLSFLSLFPPPSLSPSCLFPHDGNKEKPIEHRAQEGSLLVRKRAFARTQNSWHNCSGTCDPQNCFCCWGHSACDILSRQLEQTNTLTGLQTNLKALPPPGHCQLSPHTLHSRRWLPACCLPASTPWLLGLYVCTMTKYSILSSCSTFACTEFAFNLFNFFPMCACT